MPAKHIKTVICTLIVLLYLFKLNQVRWWSIHVCGVLIFRVQNINEGPAIYKKTDSKLSELYAKNLAVHKFQILRILHKVVETFLFPPAKIQICSLDKIFDSHPLTCIFSLWPAPELGTRPILTNICIQ